jgi:xylulose-5-phosphate/fructose-6-phosphate phosphoketolase
LSVGQIYLLNNPLLREPRQPSHIKPRLLGHFGTTPGLNFIYVHLNRVIKERDLNVIYVTGPGHGAPATAYRELLAAVAELGYRLEASARHIVVIAAVKA